MRSCYVEFNDLAAATAAVCALAGDPEVVGFSIHCVVSHGPDDDMNIVPDRKVEVGFSLECECGSLQEGHFVEVARRLGGDYTGS